MLRQILFLFIVVTLTFSFGCKKDKLLTSGGELQFSTDTLSFDTVFTAYASHTEQIKIFNKQSQKINISSIRLEDPNQSYFNLNVNGTASNSVTNVEVAANDSFYVFVTVNIDPAAGSNNPFLIHNRIIATLNGKEYSIPLRAFGQNAYYIIDSFIKQSETWKTDKPYVILHSALVDTYATLTIPAGCKVFMNQDSRLYVRGSLKIEGTQTDSVVFQGSRLDRKYYGYEGYPAEWGGIYFFSVSHDNDINYAVLKNCGNTTGVGLPSAIQLEPYADNAPYQLNLRHSIIYNSIGYGILGFQGSMKAENCLVHTCGAQALALFQGGNYEITNCSFVNFSTDKISHTKEPTVALLNYLDLGNEQYVVGKLNARLKNCVIWGGLDDELYFDQIENAAAPYNVIMDHCLMKQAMAIPAFVTLSNNIVNQEPQFVNRQMGNYRLNSNSPLIDKGATPAVINDLDGKARNGVPDIGCYEF